MTISKKKEKALYVLIDKDIMNARIKILCLLKGTSHCNSVDDIMYQLNVNTPAKAVDLFKATIK